jgi:phosphoglycerate dehydrogenase-like enzyme
MDPWGSGDGVALRRSMFEDAVSEAGGRLVDLDEAQGVLWADNGGATELAAAIDANPALQWVQLPWAGVDGVASSGIFDRPVTFTCLKGMLGEPVAEHALMLAMMATRNAVRLARTPHWLELEPGTLFRKRVTIIGAGGIGLALAELLQPFDCEITVVRRSTDPVVGAARTVQPAALLDVLPETDVLVLAAPATAETRCMIGEAELAALPSSAVLVNVARGSLVDTDALTAALQRGSLAGAGLDVTDPEPLPSTHALWSMDTVMITSHTADSLEYVADQLRTRFMQNIRRFAAGEPLEGVIDPAARY